MKVTALITCAGSGERAGFGFNKLLKDTGGVTPFERCLSAFISSSAIDEYIVTCRKEDESAFRSLSKKLGVSPIFVLGGETRALSVKAGLETVTGDIVVIHDGARPFVTEEIIRSSIESAKKYGSGIAAVPATDTIGESEKTADGVFLVRSFRAGKYYIQTPQTFKTELIKKAYASTDDYSRFTDDSGIYCEYIGNCRIVEGSIVNKKLTFKEDFGSSGSLRAGTGFDLHKLVEGRKLILGGIEIPHTKGLLGHSDADVLTHAIMDALLSAASLGDIGRHFPDTDPAYKGISSIILLERVMELLKKSGYKPINVTAVIMAEKPKLSPYVEKIRANLAKYLGLDETDVGITCTTLEGIGTVGREEGIAVQSYCLTEKING
ncbi:MAG: 2-C-methyl-D-erythritol 2,4-cyclodiphosphate synthase [Clostridia bacterium]|nr:2-C-methyl-D-erythritol 2,4-cyclodiphosphate synthase [Clostridia bacterium]